MLGRLPIRWRLAAICAGLTFVILVCFAVVLGNLVGDRIRDDFEDELRTAAGALAEETQVGRDAALGPVVSSPRLIDFAMADDAVIRVVDGLGRPLATTHESIDLGPPRTEISEAGRLSVATEPVPESGPLPAFVQYARPDSDVEATVDRLWLFLAAGVLGGSLLAAFAGLAVADRAMRPIASLTSLARDIAATRDPSRRMPVPAADDEVGELARTMDQMLASLDAAREERERSFDRQREFVADASHELRTPLTSVQANLELLQTSTDGEPDDRQAIHSALRSTRRMSRLVADLSMLARADAGRAAARRTLDLAAVAERALAEVEPIASRHRIDSDFQGPLPVNANPDELHRLAVNLLDNAVRHTPDGSRIALRARRDGEVAVLEVADDGPGLPAGIEDQVFERFVRGSGTADIAGGEGSGLGLAIVRAVAESHGGAVSAQRSELGGARFEVRLPLVEVQDALLASGLDETPPVAAKTPSPGGHRADG